MRHWRFFSQEIALGQDVIQLTSISLYLFLQYHLKAFDGKISQKCRFHSQQIYVSILLILIQRNINFILDISSYSSLNTVNTYDMFITVSLFSVFMRWFDFWCILNIIVFTWNIRPGLLEFKRNLCIRLKQTWDHVHFKVYKVSFGRLDKYTVVFLQVQLFLLSFSYKRVIMKVVS